MTAHDVAQLFEFRTSPLELVLRGTAVYWFLFGLFRVVLRRDVSGLGIADVLLIVLIADASQNAMGGQYETIAEGFLLVATLAGWNLLVDWASWRFPPLRRFTAPQPLLLVRRGRFVEANMRRELMTREDLVFKLREQGIERLEVVKEAYMEPDGQISAIKR
ncbi:MAG TPA: YetF domain-containing protein [Methylibium sp.]|uniref:DUF421 domain-containing protein n=1 Tax=Methylibium sp. TaxID=2067992 RepID=UPI002DB9D101|nr:YetF domain-containing protein [Methylibium sp.]HEU4459121.1 YetF domain-containing protein [Methylibium sp.]